MELLDSPDNLEPLDSAHLLFLDHLDLPDLLVLLDPLDKMEIWLNPELKAHQAPLDPQDRTEILVKMDNQDLLEDLVFLDPMLLTVLVLQELAKQQLVGNLPHPMVILQQLLLFNLLLNKVDTEERFLVRKEQIQK